MTRHFISPCCRDKCAFTVYRIFVCYFVLAFFLRLYLRFIVVCVYFFSVLQPPACRQPVRRKPCRWLICTLRCAMSWKERRTGNNFFSYPLWLFSSHLIVLPCSGCSSGIVSVRPSVRPSVRSVLCRLSVFCTCLLHGNSTADCRRQFAASVYLRGEQLYAVGSTSSQLSDVRTYSNELI
jgi:hypothetical protein